MMVTGRFGYGACACAAAGNVKANVSSTRANRPRVRAVEQGLQLLVIGTIERLDAHPRVGEAQLAAVDLGAIGDDARNGAEAGADARAGAVDIGGQRVGEHRRVELPRLAVRIDIGTRKEGLEQRRAAFGGTGEQLVDEGVLGAAQGEGIEPRRRDEAGRIAVAAMRRGEDHRCRLLRRGDDGERRIDRIGGGGL